MGGIRAMLFTAHINITTLAENEQGQTRKHRKTYSNFPHTISFNKKGSTREPVKHPASRKAGATHSIYAQSLA